MKTKIMYSIILVAFLALTGCEEPLQEDPKSEIASTNIFDHESTVLSLLNDSYFEAQQHWFHYPFRVMNSIISAGLAKGSETGPMSTRLYRPAENFTWSDQFPLSDAWVTSYFGMRNVNFILDNIEENGDNLSEEFKSSIIAQCKCMRGFWYQNLWKLYGLVPLKITSEPVVLPRATKEELFNQIEKDLTEAAEVLPLEQEEFGRYTKGNALGILTKFYLQSKQWQKAADAAKDVMDLGLYGLMDDYREIFLIDNEGPGNQEMVMVHPRLANPNHSSQILMRDVIPLGWPGMTGRETAGAIFVLDSFLDSFDPQDTRDDLIKTKYYLVNPQTGDSAFVQGYGSDSSFVLKHQPDPDASVWFHGNDMPEIRYSDILLTRAEALNELNGPNQESIDLINQVRQRAGISDLNLSDFGSKEELRSTILEERLKEFYFEAQERDDLIRHGEFLSRARARGIDAKEFHLILPITARELNNNDAMDQNPGY